MKPRVESKHLLVDPRRPEPQLIARAAALIRKGAVVIFPTQGLYGLGADALQADAVERVFALKSRNSAKPILVLIHRRNQLDRLVSQISPLTHYLMDHFWPGQVTFVVPAAPGLPAGLVSPQGKIGVRLAGHPVAAALAAAVGNPITGTSANLSGRSGGSVLSDLAPEVTAAADLILDAGRLAGGPGSTVVDASVAPPRVLREGAVSTAHLLAAYARFQNHQP